MRTTCYVAVFLIVFWLFLLGVAAFRSLARVSNTVVGQALQLRIFAICSFSYCAVFLLGVAELRSLARVSNAVVGQALQLRIAATCLFSYCSVFLLGVAELRG